MNNIDERIARNQQYMADRERIDSEHLAELREQRLHSQYEPGSDEWITERAAITLHRDALLNTLEENLSAMTNYHLLTDAGRQAVNERLFSEGEITRLPIGSTVRSRDTLHGSVISGKLTDLRENTLIATVETEFGREYVASWLIVTHRS